MNIYFSNDNMQQPSVHVTGLHNNQNTSKNNNQSQIKNGTIFAGNLNTNMTGQDQITDKKVQAQKQAMKLKLDQLERDNKTDDNLSKMKDNIKKYMENAKQIQGNINDIQNAKKQLQEAYGIDSNSEEQKNLNTLEKSMNPNETLTEEEQQQLSKMGSLTDYQKEALRYDTMQSVFENRLADAKNGIESSEQSIDGIKLSLLKTHPMVDAQKEAAKIMESASKEAISMLYKQAQDKIDKDMEKTKEDAEKKADKDKEQKEKVEKSQSSNSSSQTGDVNQSTSANTDDSMKDVQDADQKADKIVTELKKVIDQNGILEDDAKGIVVDKHM